MKLNVKMTSDDMKNDLRIPFEGKRPLLAWLGLSSEATR